MLRSQFSTVVAAILALGIVAPATGCSASTESESTAERAPAAPANGVSGLGLIGVDYAPGHYTKDDPRNSEPQGNAYAELRQLKDAGFTTVRLYGDPGKTWVAVIEAADKLGMQVVYQLAICESSPDNNCVKTKPSDPTMTYDGVEAVALTQLRDVIQVVGKDTFQNTVKLVIVGNEVLWSDATTSNANKITHSIGETKKILDAAGLGSIPLTVALQADVWVGNKLPGRQDIVNALPPGSPIAINAYPFQWSLHVDDSMDPSKDHSLPHYVDALKQMYPSHPVVISETGWATAGTFKLGKNVANGDPADAAKYYVKLYDYVVKQQVPTLTFMAFDTPTKSEDANTSSENFYGVFDQKCALKSVQLVPNQSYAAPPACGDQQSLFTFNGSSTTAQPPFSIVVTRAGTSVAIVDVPTIDRGRSEITPWPTLMLQKGDKVTLQGSTYKCSNTLVDVSSTHSGGTWTSRFGDEGCSPNYTAGAVDWNGGQNVQVDKYF